MDDEFIQKSFNIYQQNYDYLEQQNPDNISHALRQILTEHQTQKNNDNNKIDYNQTFTYASYSILLFFIAYLLEPPIQQISIIFSLLFTMLTLNTAHNQHRRKK